jgi:hypothetical protein
MLKKSEYFLTRDSSGICLRKLTIYYVLKEVLCKNIFSFIAAVRVFMNFLCVSSEVNKERRFVSRRNQKQIFRLHEVAVPWFILIQIRCFTHIIHFMCSTEINIFTTNNQLGFVYFGDLLTL